MKVLFRSGLAYLLTGGMLMAQSASTSQTAPTKARTSRSAAARRHAATTTGTEPSVASQLQELREMLVSQQRQIQQLQDQLAARDQQVQQAQQTASEANTKASEAATKVSAVESSTSDATSQVASLKETVSAIKVNDQNLAETVQSDQKRINEATKNKVEEKLSDLAYGKVTIGATFYGDFAHYNDAGFAPAFSDLPSTQLGPGNSGLNSFEITRAYINLFYTPSEHVTLRITPDIYRQIDSTDGAISSGNGAQVGGTENGSLTFRLKYAYVDLQNYFGKGKFAKSKITFGQTQNPLIDWEEGLSGHRYTYLVPWNYLSLSSTYVGARLRGPIESNGKEYLDYDLGVFTTASFHSIETNDKKQAMARLTWYPLGTTSDRTGFGLTFFENYGYNTRLPSQVSTPLNRIAVLGHYQSHSKDYEIVGEYDLGRNAFSTGNLFSGSGPVVGGPFNTFNTLAGSLLGGTHTRQQGFDFFGHARLGHSPFSLWGFYQNFQPNTRVAGDNPLDFSRTVGGISYKVTDHFDFAVGDQNFHWLHPQGLVPGGDTNAIVLWTQFNY